MADEPVKVTWREKIVGAGDNVENARVLQREVWQQARNAGLTLGQIGDAAGVSASAVGSCTVAPASVVSLDDPVG